LFNLTENKRLENAEIERLYIEGQERLKELQLDPETNAFEINNVQAGLNAKLSAIEFNNSQIEDATKKHNQNLKKQEEDNAKAKDKINKLNTKNRLDELSAYGDAI